MIKQAINFKQNNSFKMAFLVAKNARFFATVGLQRKNYYDILGLTRNATQEEIKNAYRELAKKYHPDVNTAGSAYEPNAERFRDVAEAYAILNVTESRIQYDLSLTITPESEQASQKIDLHRQFRPRGKDGNPIKEKYKPDSYAAQKQEILKEERKKFNIDEFGRFKGGVPQKGKGAIRGSALGSPGSMHDPDIIQEFNEFKQTEQRVTEREANAFKNWMQSDSFGIKRRFLWFETHIDYEFFRFKNYRYGLRFARNIFLLFIGFPFLNEILLKSYNRTLFNKTVLSGHLVPGKPLQIGTDKVILSPSGILKVL